MPSEPLRTPARPYDWLLFDADGTLFDFDRAETAALEEAFGAFGLLPQPEWLPLYRRINGEVWRDLEQGLISPGRLKLLRFERLLAALRLDCPPAAFSEAYLATLSRCAHLMDGALELIRGCREFYKLALVTNGLQAVQRGRLARSPLGEVFSPIVISEEIGVAKPDRRFFEVAFTRMGSPDPRRVLLVGDNWSSDIAGAAAYGLDTCWFNPQGTARPPAPLITLEVGTLSALGQWLGITPP